MELTVSQIQAAIREAQEAAYEASDKFFKSYLNGQDQGACGFAWVNIYKFNGTLIKGNTKIGRAMKAAGLNQSYDKVFQLWNPSRYGCQNIDTLEAGARAAADVLKKYGFSVSACSRLD